MLRWGLRKREVVLREFFALVFKFDLKGLLVKPTTNVVIQTFRALFVGAASFLGDAGMMWLVYSLTGAHYLICSGFGFIIGVAVNYTLSVKFVFAEKASVGRAAEILIYVIVCLIGLGLTAVFMWFFTDVAGLFFMVSKCIVTVIVFFWNFTARKVTLYRGNGA